MILTENRVTLYLFMAVNDYICGESGHTTCFMVINTYTYDGPGDTTCFKVVKTLTINGATLPFLR